jgi:predicted porin
MHRDGPPGPQKIIQTTRDNRMRKKLFTFAPVLAGCFCSMHAHAADSSVTLFGLLDGGISYVSNEGGHRNLKWDDGMLAPNLFGLRGNEDLGGGVSAQFALVNQFHLGSGASLGANTLFGREAWVGVTDQRLGSLSFGNQYDFLVDYLSSSKNSPAIEAGGLYAFVAGPFAKLALPGDPGPQFGWDRTEAGFELNNTVKYTTPDMRGLSLGAMYGFGGVAGSFGANSSMSFGARYARGPFGLAAAYVSYKSSLQANLPVRNWGIGTHYDFGKLSVSGDVTGVRNTANGGAIVQGSIGASYLFAADWLLAGEYSYMKGNAYLDNNHAHQITSTLSYIMSKRTVVYVQAALQRTNASAPGSANGGALISGVLDTDGQSSSPTQFIGRVGFMTRF